MLALSDMEIKNGKAKEGSVKGALACKTTRVDYESRKGKMEMDVHRQQEDMQRA